MASVLSYNKKYSKQYGQLVIACDGRDCWRKQIFPQYKYSRKISKEKSDLDWSLVYDLVGEFRADLKNVFPYPVIHEDGAEADDIIAVLCEWSQTNNLVTQGLVEEPAPILILSSDGDFKQLQKYKNVRQWSNLTQKFVVASPAGVKTDLITKIVKGDGGDGIPNIYMPDDHYVNGTTRQKSVMKARLDEFIEKGIEACQNDLERAGYQRNDRLISFEHIPDWVKTKIIDKYNTNGQKLDRMAILSYLQKHRCRQLIENIEDF